MTWPMQAAGIEGVLGSTLAWGGRSEWAGLLNLHFLIFEGIRNRHLMMHNSRTLMAHLCAIMKPSNFHHDITTFSQS